MKADDLAPALRGFGPIGLLALGAIYLGNALFIPLSALLVLVWAWRSRTPWRELGLARPASWAAAIVGGVLFGVGLKLVMKAVVLPLLGAPATNGAFQFLVGNTAALPAMLFMVIVGAGFGEEVLFRGFLFERLGKLFGPRRGTPLAIVLLTAIWFGLEHYSLQGVPGVQQATLFGLVWGAIRARTGSIWMLAVAHAAFDVTAVAIIYWDLETTVAHWVF